MKKYTESNATNLLTVILAVLVLIASPGLMVKTALSAGLLVTTADDENDGCAVGNCSLREAIAAASPGDTITFAGDYDIVLTSTLTIDKALIIDGSDHAITVNGNDAVRVFHVSADTHATFNHLTICHGKVTTPESYPYPAGGGIKIESGAVVTLTNSVVDSNVATYYDAVWNEYYGHGGGIFNQGTLTVSGTTFSNNVASSSTGHGFGSGGAIDNGGTLSVSGSTFTGNGATSGGAIYSDSGTTMVVENSTFTGNSAPCGGGGITGQGTTTVSGCTISNNLSPGGWCEGGAAGISNRGGIMTVSNSIVSGNIGLTNSGGLSNYIGELTVTESAIYSNTGGSGGGIYNNYFATLTVQNCTIHNNTAGWAGGGISNWYSATLTVQNCTISGNTASDFGGGIFNFDATYTVTNSILWGNTATEVPQIYNWSTGTGPTISYSDIQGSGGSSPGWDSALGADGGGNLDQDPLLGPLTDNGGPTPTQALLVGSPAIDTADALTCPGTDQRGVPRPLGDGCDMGAFEYGGDIVLFHAVTYDANGATSGIAPANQTKIYNVALTLATNSGGLARNGYTFSGWNTASDGSGTDYAEGAPYTANSAVTLYAKWVAAAGPTAIPTLSEWGMILFFLLMTAAAVIFMRKRSKMAT